MLEEHRIAAQGGVEDADVKDALAEEQQESDGQHRRAQNLDQAGGVVGPDEQRHAEPGHSRRAHAWTVTMKFRPVRIEEKPAMKMPQRGGEYPRFE